MKSNIKPHIILINSPLFKESNPLYDEDSLPPLGLGYIGTSLQQSGIGVTLIDAVASRISLKDLQTMLSKKRPRFMGINIFTTNFKLVKELVCTLDFPTHIIIGGLSTKELYKDIFQWENENPIDIVAGDGELITQAIICNTLEQRPNNNLKNKRFFQVDTNSPYYVKDIEKLSLSRALFTNEPLKHPLGFEEINIVTSRGCIYNCSFCAAAHSLNKQFGIRERSILSVQDELSKCRDSFPNANSVRVLDDLFLKTSKHIAYATEVFKPFSYLWRSMAHVQTFNKSSELELKNLKKSGCMELFIGIESGSPKILKAINKTKNTDLILSNLTKVFESGINIKGYFIYGFPNETEADMLLTYELASELKRRSIMNGVNFRTSVFQYRPYHGTQIFHDLEIQGTNLDVNQVTANKILSDLVGRLQFNFHSGNYSKVDVNILNDYIYKTINLNDGKIFAGLECQAKPSKI